MNVIVLDNKLSNQISDKNHLKLITKMAQEKKKF